MKPRLSSEFERNCADAAGAPDIYSTPMIRIQMNRSDWAILVALALIWGGAFFFISVAVRDVPPLTYVLLRLAIASAGLWLFLWWKGRDVGLPRQVWGSMLVLALLNNVIPFALFGWGQTHIASGLASILNATTPIWGVVVAHLFTSDERMTQRKIAGVLLGFGGVAMMIGPSLLANIGTDALAQLAITRMQRRGRRQVVSVITLLRRTAKILLLLFFGIGLLDTFGIDVTTGIAALGIGGIALALGAQKTVENLVGSVTVIADRPAQVGDFIKVGDVIGTVEDIGIRSSRIRTLSRTLVTIPNGDFSSRQIENFAARDSFLFNPVVSLDYRTPAARIEEAIGIIRQVLHGHENIGAGARANMLAITPRSYDIEVFSYITVSDWDASVLIREALLLSIIRGLDEAGFAFAFPAQTINLAPEQVEALKPGPAAQQE